MLLFIVSLMICLLISTVLAVLFFKSVRINWHQKNRRPISYLAPVACVFILIIFTTTQTIPRLLDIVPIAGDMTASEEMVLQEGDIGWVTFSYQQQRYWYNRWLIDLSSDTAYRVRYTPFSYFVISADEIAETATSPQ